ncbi:hypothetical protein JCM3765_005233 [Sporobolomyces pararoseus]
MFVSEERRFTRACKVEFEVDLRDLEDNPKRSERGINQRRLPRCTPVEEGPFSFTLTHEQSKEYKDYLIVRFSVARRDVTGDESLDCEQTIEEVRYQGEGGTTRMALGSDVPFYSRSFNFPSGRNSEFTASERIHWSSLPLYYGAEEPVSVTVSFELKAIVKVSAPNSTIPSLQALDNGGAFVTSPHPNDVAFILSSAPSRPLYSNKSVLSAASPYFKNHFDPLPRSRRASEAIKRTPSFVDDSDADSGDEDDADLEMLIPPELLGTRQSKRKNSADAEEEQSNIK